MLKTLILLCLSKNLIEYMHEYVKASGILWEYYRDDSPVVDNSTIANFTDDNTTDLFNLKRK